METKPRILYLQKILLERTDEENPLSTTQLINILNDEYGISAHRTTVIANFFISFSPSYYDYIRLMSGDIIAQTYRIINELSEFTQCSIFSNCFTFLVFDRSSTNVGFLPAWKDNSRLYSSNIAGIFSTSPAASGFISNETFSPFCFTSVI